MSAFCGRCRWGHHQQRLDRFGRRTLDLYKDTYHQGETCVADCFFSFSWCVFVCAANHWPAAHSARCCTVLTVNGLCNSSNYLGEADASTALLQALVDPLPHALLPWRCVTFLCLLDTECDLVKSKSKLLSERSRRESRKSLEQWLE